MQRTVVTSVRFRHGDSCGSESCHHWLTSRNYLKPCFPSGSAATPNEPVDFLTYSWDL